MSLSVSHPELTRPAPATDREHLGSIALDQWRGLALVLVLLSHGFFFTGRVHGIGRVGVNLFFFISGILVFRSLSRTRAATPWERTRSFWWRRFRRLYPALLTYSLAGVGVVWLAQGRPGLPPMSDLGSYLKALPVAWVYGTNYYTERSPLALGHLWSLACEMQFYLVGPLLYWLGGTSERRRNLVFGSLLVLLMGLGVSHPVLRHWNPSVDAWKYHFEFSVWPMLLGFCCEYKRGWFRLWPAWLVTVALWLGAAVCGLSMAIMLLGLEMKPLVIASGALLLVPCLMAYLFGRPMLGVGGRWLRWMGERTYSIYLWQQPLSICGFLPTFLHPFGAAAAVGVGGVWFHFFERPFLSASRKVEAGGRASWLLRGMGIALVLMVVAALGAVWLLRSRYEERLRAQIWPTAAPAAAVQVSKPASPGPTVLLLGDSRVTQWGTPQLAGWHVVNAGLNGATSGQTRLRTGALLEEFHPQVVVLQVGINDLKYLGLRPELSPSMISLTASNLAAIAAECLARGCKVVVLETWPPGRPSLARLPVWSGAIAPSVAELNTKLRAAASPEKGIWVVDLFNRAGLQAGPGMYRDTLHFTPELYARLTPALEKELDSEVRKASAPQH